MASTSQPPRRRFLPQPVETTARSSRRQHVETPDQNSSLSEGNRAKDEAMAATTRPKRFLPQPVEETTRSLRRKNEEGNMLDSRNKVSTNVSGVPPTQSDDSTQPGYPTSRPSISTRRFTPEPVETTARSSRRKFAIEPVETTTRSSKQEKEATTSPSSRPRRRFVPEPVETTTVRRRRNDQDEDSNESPPDSPSGPSSRASSRQSTGSRRFSPELIETAKASYRHKKDPDSPRSTQHLKLTHSPPPPPSRSSTKSPEPADGCESRFSAAALAKRNHEERRQHSYCIPNLPDIESESSSDESTPSLTESPSSTDNELHRLGKIKEQPEAESYTDYVLALTESNERKKLQQQVMAAYINEVPHEPVSHFAGDAEDDEDLVHIGHLSADDGADPKTFRRSSQDEHDWEMENMRRHHEQLEQAKKELQEDTAGASRFSAAALASRHHLGQTHKQPAKTKKQKDEDAEFARMKKAASPPMLGDDLVFPYTISPKMTRCDVDQAPRPRRADSDDDTSSVDAIGQQLWCSQINSQSSAEGGLWMGMCQKAESPAGLWMGSCQRGPDYSRPTTPTKSGIQTPAFESPNPFESLTPGRGTRTPRRIPRPYSGLQFLPTPPRSHEGSRDDFTDSVDKKLQLEKQIEEEFPPRVITQIYNYLSLGFPSLARDFDEELSKISRIPVKELRKDDGVAQGIIKGHVGTPETEGRWEEEEDGTVKGCRRWDALKLYVKEWARQSPNFTTSFPVATDPALAHVKVNKVDAWGITVRKGSWAL